MHTLLPPSVASLYPATTGCESRAPRALPSLPVQAQVRPGPGSASTEARDPPRPGAAVLSSPPCPSPAAHHPAVSAAPASQQPLSRSTCLCPLPEPEWDSSRDTHCHHRRQKAPPRPLPRPPELQLQAGTERGPHGAQAAEALAGAVCPGRACYLSEMLFVKCSCGNPTALHPPQRRGLGSAHPAQRLLSGTVARDPLTQLAPAS